MSFLDSLSGASQRRDMRNAGAAFADGHAGATRHWQNASSSAKNYLTPYQQRGDAAYQQYSDAIGVNGNALQSKYWDNYQADPQRGYDENRAVDAVNRSMAARGMSKSGFGALAGARAGMDAGRSYTTERLNRLQGLGAQGMGAANQLANIDMTTGQGLAGLDMALGQSNAGMHMGMAGTRNAGWNNAMQFGGSLVSGMTPGASGQSPFGNMLTGLKGVI